MKIQIESSTACNAKCTFCPRYDMTRPRGEMSDELFHKIIRDGQEMHGSYYTPMIFGDPFVFPRIWDWLDYLAAENCRVHIFTNAERMDVDKLVKYPNLRVVCCSINAATKETYDKVVRGPDYEKVVANVRQLIKARPCRVFASMVVVEANQHEVEDFKKLWPRNYIFGEFKNYTGDRHDKLERTGERVPCWPLLNSMTVLWDGRVVPCCMDYDAKLVLGDVNHQTLTEIWHQSYWMRHKNRHLDFDMVPCRECNHNVI